MSKAWIRVSLVSLGMVYRRFICWRRRGITCSLVQRGARRRSSLAIFSVIQVGCMSGGKASLGWMFQMLRT